jgi:hypothetical protein
MENWCEKKGKKETLVDNHVSSPLCQPQIPQGLYLGPIPGLSSERTASNRLCLNHGTAEIIRIETRLSINMKSVLPITTHYRHVKLSQTTKAIALHFLVADRAGHVVAPFGG